MEQELNVKLIEGNFDVADANLLLMELLRFKIGFHEQKLFRDYNEFNRDNSNSKRRIEVLNRSLQEVRRLMATAQEEDLDLEMDCVIHIKTRPARR
jgi:hypothetical protein